MEHGEDFDLRMRPVRLFNVGHSFAFSPNGENPYAGTEMKFSGMEFPLVYSDSHRTNAFFNIHSVSPGNRAKFYVANAMMEAILPSGMKDVVDSKTGKTDGQLLSSETRCPWNNLRQPLDLYVLNGSTYIDNVLMHGKAEVDFFRQDPFEVNYGPLSRAEVEEAMEDIPVSAGLELDVIDKESLDSMLQGKSRSQASPVYTGRLKMGGPCGIYSLSLKRETVDNNHLLLTLH